MTTQYNVTTYGTLTNTNGVLSNFSVSNYATLPVNFNPSQQSYEIVFKFNTVDVSEEQGLFALYNADNYTFPVLNIEILNGVLYFETTSGEVQYNEIIGSTTLNPNTDYWVKVNRNSDTYTLYISTNGTTWTTEGTSTISSNPPLDNYIFIIGLYYTTIEGFKCPLMGSIDLKESYIDINNVRWWQGVTSTSNVQTRIQLRHDTAANWTSVNPILLEGEVGIETDTRKQKFGDGTTAWNSLAYSVNTIDNKAFDGQWIALGQDVIATAVSVNGSTDLPYTVNVPNDGHVYEVMIRADASTNATSGNWFIVGIKTNSTLTGDYAFICGAKTTSNSTVGSMGTVIVPIKYATNNLYLRRNTNYHGSTMLKALAYRRVGTNS